MEHGDPVGEPVQHGVYPKGSAAFDRAVFFSDAVFAIAITLAAVTIGIPEVEGHATNHSLWEALREKGPNLWAFALTFAWVAFYWRANHKFTVRLGGIDGRYIAALLVYLAFIALLPVATGTLGEYANATALSLFLVAVAIISSMEVVLLTVAYRDRLLAQQPAPAQYRKESLSSLTPVVVALLGIPVAFLSVPLAVVFLIGGSVALGTAVARLVKG